MNRDEFRAGIIEALSSMKDPNSEYHALIRELKEISEEVGAFDAELGKKVLAISECIQDLGSYICSRADDGEGLK